MAIQSQQSLNDLAVASQFGFAVSSGQVTGYEQLNLFGYNGNVPIDNEVNIDPSNVLYYYPTTENILTVSSSQTENLSLLIVGRDSNYNTITEVVLLNGTNTVTVNNKFFRFVFARVISNNNLNHGDITIAHPEDSNSKNMITSDNNISQSFSYTVPKNKETFVQGITLFAGDSREVTYKFKIREAIYGTLPDGTNDYNNFQGHYPWATFFEAPLVESSVGLDLKDTPFLVTPRSDLTITAVARSTSTKVSASATFTNKDLIGIT